MYNPYLCLHLEQAWDVVSLLSHSAQMADEHGDIEAEHTYRLALMLCAQWFPTTRQYASLAERFAAFLREEGREEEAHRWEATTTQIRTHMPLLRAPLALAWQERTPRPEEYARVSVTECVLYALEAMPQETRDLLHILREADQPIAELRRYIAEGFASPTFYASLREPPTVDVAMIDSEEVIVIAFMRAQMSELEHDLALAQGASLPAEDAWLALPLEHRPPTLSFYLVSTLAELLSHMQQRDQHYHTLFNADEQMRRTHQKVIQSAQTALRIARRVGLAPVST
jgi:hypothetical protein